MYGKTFNALANEASFAFEILNSGITQIRKANYAKKGVYFQSFINLSVGLERIGKLCLILDHYIENDGKFPTEKYLKKNIGHNIQRLYENSIVIKEKHQFKFKWLDDLNNIIHQNILNILSDFAITDRYENLNILVNAKQENNPIMSWYTNVDMQIFEQRITNKKKIKIMNEAEKVHKLMSQSTFVMYSSEDGKELNKVNEVAVETGIYNAVSPYRQLYVAQIIRFWIELIWKLQYKAMDLGKEEIPFFSDMFGCFYNDDSYFRTIRNYERC